jgi:hypothetical protein
MQEESGVIEQAQEVQHSSRGHAIYAPSMGSRWAKENGCTAAPFAIAQMPHEESGEAAIAGTEAHEEIERCFGPMNGEFVTPTTMPIKPVDPDHPAAFGIALMISYVRQLPPGRLWIERPVELTKDIYGTPDVRHWEEATGILTVPDFKNGFIGVDADTEQLWIYAASSVYTDNLPLKWARLVIVQPNDFRPVPRVKQHMVSADELFAFAKRAAAVPAGPKEFRAGSHCAYCPVFGKCEATRDLLMQLGILMQHSPDELRPDQVALVMSIQKPVTDWFKSLEKVWTKKALNGTVPEGMKMVTSQKHKAWENEDQARALVLEHLGPDGLDVPTPAQAIERGIPERIVNAMAPRPPGAPVLAFASDKRPAFERKSAAEMFAGVTGAK